MTPKRLFYWLSCPRPSTGSGAASREAAALDPRLRGGDEEKERFTIASCARLAALGIATAVTSLASPAQADFYSLAGRFECLAKPEGSCGGPGRAELLPPPAPKKPVVKETTAAVAPSQRAEPQQPQQQPTAPQTQASASRARGPVETIAAAIRRGQVSAEDRATLQRLSQAGNAHATELLAWCDYKGIGAAPDPVAAYVLYGIAALAGVPTARQNQAVISDYALTSEQRQKGLDMQNELLANP